MRKVIIISLYTIIFLLVASINIISIKKFFDIKKDIYKLDDVIANNFVTTLVSFNKIKSDPVLIKPLNIEIVDENILEKEVIQEDIENEKIVEEQSVLESEKEDVKTEEKEDVLVNDDVTLESSTDALLDSILYDGLSEQDLIVKLEKSLKNELSGTGVNFVEYYKNTGLDPYLAVAIVLHETGCTWSCSNLVKECFNYGGMKGGENKYKDTRYTCYSSKEEGINAYLNMLYNNYYAKGLNTPELINPKYAASLEWANKINNYITKIKNK